MKNDLTAQQIRAWLDYNPETGEFRWKVEPNRNIKIGTLANSYDTKGYIRIGLNGEGYKAHRLAWLHYYGIWPPNEIDHINQKRDDNRICNLRLSNRVENARNQKIPKNNTTGFKGVTYLGKSHMWRASITVKGECIILGTFPDKMTAAYVRRNAEIKYGFTEATK